AAAAWPEAPTVPLGRIAQGRDIRARSCGRWAKEHPVARRFDPHTQRIARHQVRLGLFEQGVRNLQAAALAPLGKRDADVGALGAGERLELGCEPGSGQYSEQTALRCRDRAEAHGPLSVTAAAGEAAPAPPVRALFGLAHVELPALDVAPVQRRDGLL